MTIEKTFKGKPATPRIVFSLIDHPEWVFREGDNILVESLTISGNNYCGNGLPYETVDAFITKIYKNGSMRVWVVGCGDRWKKRIIRNPQIFWDYNQYGDYSSPVIGSFMWGKKA